MLFNFQDTEVKYIEVLQVNQNKAILQKHNFKMYIHKHKALGKSVKKRRRKENWNTYFSAVTNIYSHAAWALFHATHNWMLQKDLFVPCTTHREYNNLVFLFCLRNNKHNYLHLFVCIWCSQTLSNCILYLTRLKPIQIKTFFLANIQWWLG